MKYMSFTVDKHLHTFQQTFYTFARGFRGLTYIESAFENLAHPSFKKEVHSFEAECEHL